MGNLPALKNNEKLNKMLLGDDGQSGQHFLFNVIKVIVGKCRPTFLTD